MATTEHTINDAIAELLRGTRWAWRGSDVVRSETTGLLAGASGLRPDILVTEPYTAPVVIETEVLPAVTVEAEAICAIGRRHLVAAVWSTILSAIPVRLPHDCVNLKGSALKIAIKVSSI